MLESLFKETKERMEKTVDALNRHLSKMRTGRATASLVDDIRIECYGEKVPLSQLATVSIPEGGLIVIQPWDPSLMKNIETGILRSGSDLTPASDGNLIRITIPPLSEERRKKLATDAAKSCEESRAVIRSIRKDTKNHIRTMEKKKDISEDETSVAVDDLQKVTDEFVAKIQEIQERKQKDLMEF